MGSVKKVHDKTPKNQWAQGLGNKAWQYTHDPLRRLTSATGREDNSVIRSPSWELNTRLRGQSTSQQNNDHPNTSEYLRSYQYDKQGNILELDHKADLVTGQDFTREFNYGTGTQSNRLQSFDVTSNNYSYSYDANGNLIQENTDRYFEWNYADKLAFFKRQAGGGNPSVWVHYLYDNEGNRIKKFVNKGSNIYEITIYIDGIYEYSYRIEGTTVISNHNYNTLHIMDGSSRIATVRVGNHTADTTPAQKFFVEDHLGNASVVVNTSGGRINLEEYYPFGETAFGSYQYKRYRYNGKEKDEHTGLYEYGQRYYAPWLCRFVSVDPVAEKFADLSSYNYAGNKPMTKVDQEGLQEKNRKETQQNHSNPNSFIRNENNNSNGPLSYNEVLGIDPVIVTYRESQEYSAESKGTTDGFNSQSELTSPESQNDFETIEGRANSQATPVIKELLELGSELSQNFGKLMIEAGIDANSFSQPIFYRSDIEYSGTFPDGTIQLKYPNNNIQLIQELTHELSNRVMRMGLQENRDSLKAGLKTPEEYAQTAIELEFLGQKNQILVASETGYRYSPEIQGANDLNALIEKIANGENINLDKILTPNTSKFNKYVNNANQILSEQRNQNKSK